MKKQLIILAEDDQVLSKVVTEELTDAGFDVRKAEDGEAALSLCRASTPDLLLLDILMPKKSGFEVLEELKQKPETRHIPVIIMTMLGADDDIKKGLQLGAGDYIVKSQHAVEEIVDKVKDFLSKEEHPRAS